MQFLKHCINFILYTNTWIALCAAMLCFQTNYLLLGIDFVDTYGIVIFFSTVVLYALHRLIGIKRVDESQNKGRFKEIERLKWPIMIIGAVSAIFSAYFFIGLDWIVQALMIPGVLLSLAYVLPIFKKHHRLRDFPFIKIYLIAGVWVYLCVFIPLFATESMDLNLLLLAEKFLFIFGLTLAFDIRDYTIDKQEHVKTIPGKIGVYKTKIVGMILCSLALCFAVILWMMDTYSTGAFIGLSISYAAVIIFIWLSNTKRKDIYYSGLMDGLIAIQSFLVILLGELIHL